MRKIIILATLFAFATPLCQAQSFDALSVGAQIGSDGAGIEIATPINDHLQLRLGANIAPGWPTINLTEFRTIENPDALRPTETTCPVLVTPDQKGASLLINYYPWTDLDFYVTGGVHTSLQMHFLDIAITDLPRRYNTDTILLQMNGNTLQPYLGIGLGRPVWGDSLVGYSVEIGVRYLGNTTALTQTAPGSKEYAPAQSLVNQELVPFIEKTERRTSFLPSLSVRIYFNIL